MFFYRNNICLQGLVMKCPNCNEEIKQTDKFCANCGCDLIKEILKLAESFYYGEHLEDRVFQDELMAIGLYERAAELGSSEAENILGEIYQKGIGFEEEDKDEKKAYNWYLKAAEHGNVDGQYNLAYMYEKGIGTIKNLEKAFYWYKKSAEQENPDALNRLGYLYEKGIGITKDLARAKECYNKCNKIIKN